MNNVSEADKKLFLIEREALSTHNCTVTILRDTVIDVLAFYYG